MSGYHEHIYILRRNKKRAERAGGLAWNGYRRRFVPGEEQKDKRVIGTNYVIADSSYCCFPSHDLQ